MNSNQIKEIINYLDSKLYIYLNNYGNNEPEYRVDIKDDKQHLILSISAYLGKIFAEKYHTTTIKMETNINKDNLYPTIEKTIEMIEEGYFRTLLSDIRRIIKKLEETKVKQ